MAFCENCGTKHLEGALFCENCGTKVEINVSYEVASPNNPGYQSTNNQPQNSVLQEYQVQLDYSQPNYKTSQRSSGFKLDKKKKIILSIAVGILVMCFVAFKIGEAVTDKDKLIEKFQAALSSNDAKQVASMLKSTDQRIKIDEETVKGLFEYINSSPSYVLDLMRSISDQSQQIDRLDSSKKSEVFAYPNNYGITLKKSGKKFIFFDNYVFEVTPVFINLSTNYIDTEIFLNGERICVSDSEQFTKEIGPYFPGEYSIKAVYKGKYSTLERTEQIVGIQSDNSVLQSINVDLSMQGKYVQIDCNFSDAKLFVNGQDTGMTVSEMNQSENGGLGPVNNNVKLYAEKELPWGKIKSDEVNISDDNYVSLSIPLINDEVKKSIVSTSSKFEKEFIDALISVDSSKVTTATSDLFNDISTRITNITSYNEKFDAKIIKSDFDLGSIRVETEGDGFVAYINSHNYYFGKNKGSTIYNDPSYAYPDENYDKKLSYKLIYDSQGSTWKVMYYDYSYSDESSEIQTIVY